MWSTARPVPCLALPLNPDRTAQLSPQGGELQIECSSVETQHLVLRSGWDLGLRLQLQLDLDLGLGLEQGLGLRQGLGQGLAEQSTEQSTNASIACKC